jgi:hypothetical protein
MNIEPRKTKRRTDGTLHGHIVKSSPSGVTLFLYYNGYAYEPAHRVFLTEHVLSQKINVICGEIGEHLDAPFGAIKRLYTLDGVCVKHAQELQNNGYYVAVGRYSPFQQLNYGTHRPPFFVPKKIEKVPEPTGSKLLLTVSEESQEPTSQSAPSKSPAQNHSQKPRRLPPVKVIYADGRSVFHARPTAHKYNKSSVPSDSPYKDDNSSSTIYKAKDQRDETKDAEVVPDAFSEADEPLDSKQPQEVDEEEDAKVVPGSPEDTSATNHQHLEDDIPVHNDPDVGTPGHQDSDDNEFAHEDPRDDTHDQQDADNNAAGDSGDFIPDHQGSTLTDGVEDPQDEPAEHDDSSPVDTTEDNGAVTEVNHDDSPGAEGEGEVVVSPPENITPPVSRQSGDMTNQDNLNEADVEIDDNQLGDDTVVSNTVE